MLQSAPLPESELHISPSDERAGKYLIFQLANKNFGVAVKHVREVMEMPEITRVPNSPALIAGVINLRGKVIPVVDLRLAIGFPGAAKTPQTSIVVVRVALASVDQMLGLAVDSVTEVLHLQAAEFLQPEDFQSLSEFGTRNPARYLLGTARVEGRVKLLLDLNEVLNNLAHQPAPAFAAAA